MYRNDHEFGSVYGVTPKVTSESAFENRAKNGRVGALVMSHLTNVLWEKIELFCSFECVSTFEYVSI